MRTSKLDMFFYSIASRFISGKKNPNSIPDKFRGENVVHLGGGGSGGTFVVRVPVSRLGASSPKSTSIFPSFELRIDYQPPSSKCGM